MEGNPNGNVDPTGENALRLALWAWRGGQATGKVINLGWEAAAGNPLGVSIYNVTHSEWVDDPEAKADHDRYKDKCNQQEPPGLSLCDSLKWRLKRAQECKAGMEEWDRKWSPSGSRHMTPINERASEIKTLERKLNKECKKDDCE